MTAHSLPHRRWERRPDHRATVKGALQLGWPHFWLLLGILGGMLALVDFVFLAQV